jgi:hypothetical protein
VSATHAAARYPETMKMGRAPPILSLGSCRNEAGDETGDAIPRVSMARTALRTRDCRHPFGVSTQSRLFAPSLSSGISSEPCRQEQGEARRLLSILKLHDAGFAWRQRSFAPPQGEFSEQQDSTPKGAPSLAAGPTRRSATFT